MPTSNERKMLSSNEALKELKRSILNNFHTREVVSHDHDPQLQVGENGFDTLQTIILIIFYELMITYCWIVIPTVCVDPTLGNGV